MRIDDVMKQVAVTLERDASVRAVFGEVVKLEHHTIVPVAVVSGGGGAGGSQDEHAHGFAGGAGLALTVRPVGFISERGDDVTFTPIHLEAPPRALLAGAASGVRQAITLALAGLSRLARGAGATRFTAEVPRRDAADDEDERAAVHSPS